jgi:predicted metal-binding membrane protein
MSGTTDYRLLHLSPAAARLGFAVARPRVIAIATVVALTALGWLWLGVTAGHDLGAIGVLCRAQSNVALWGASEWTLVVLMWCAMVLAMMLPSAAPMILTYSEIAETAARKNQTVVSPFVLTAGYVAVWFVFAALAAIATMAIARTTVAVGSSITALLSAAVFIAAGLYQFSALKQACLRLCRQPFQFFFANWATTPRGVFRLGVRQGLYCLGCCWAMMAVMLATGIMNVLWMAALGAAMTVEKMTGDRVSRALGVGLIAIGAVFMLSAISSLGLGSLR